MPIDMVKEIHTFANYVRKHPETHGHIPVRLIGWEPHILEMCVDMYYAKGPHDKRVDLACVRILDVLRFTQY